MYFTDQPTTEQQHDKLITLNNTTVKQFYNFWLMTDPTNNKFYLY